MLLFRRKGEDHLVYLSKVDHGFNEVSAADLWKRPELSV